MMADPVPPGAPARPVPGKKRSALEAAIGIGASPSTGIQDAPLVADEPAEDAGSPVYVPPACRNGHRPRKALSCTQ
jgi:hypothetical protein